MHAFNFDNKLNVAYLDSFFITNNILCEQQYGFRADQYTELAATKLIVHTYEQMDQHTLNFDILLSKIKYYRLSEIYLKFIINRNQYVKFESCISNHDLI